MLPAHEGMACACVQMQDPLATSESDDDNVDDASAGMHMCLYVRASLLLCSVSVTYFEMVLISDRMFQFWIRRMSNFQTSATKKTLTLHVQVCTCVCMFVRHLCCELCLCPIFMCRYTHTHTHTHADILLETTQNVFELAKQDTGSEIHMKFSVKKKAKENKELSKQVIHIHTQNTRPCHILLAIQNTRPCEIFNLLHITCHILLAIHDIGY